MKIVNTLLPLAACSLFSSAVVSAPLTLPDEPVEYENISQLLEMCDKLENHRQVSAFDGAITCVTKKSYWLEGQPKEFSYRIPGDKFSVAANIKGKFHSERIPLGEEDLIKKGTCSVAEKWQVLGQKTIKVDSCAQLREIANTPNYCETVMECDDLPNVLTGVSQARMQEQNHYFQAECYGVKAQTIDSCDRIEPCDNEPLSQSNTPAPSDYTFSTESCKALGVDVDITLKTVEVKAGSTASKAVKVVEIGELAGLAGLRGRALSQNDLLWRINGRRVEKPLEVCHLLYDHKENDPSNSYRDPIKMSFYRVDGNENITLESQGPIELYRVNKVDGKNMREYMSASY